IQHDDYVGRLAIGRVVTGRLAPGMPIALVGEGGTVRAKVGTLYGFEAMKRVEIDEALAGDICAVAGIEEGQIGDTLADAERPVALPRIRVEEPTIKVSLHVNTSPMAGKSGKWVTSRHIKERLEREAKRNLAMRVEPTDQPDQFVVYGRGEL